MSNLAKEFHDLHNSSDLLILPCAWDVGSARLFEDAGAKSNRYDERRDVMGARISRWQCPSDGKVGGPLLAPSPMLSVCPFPWTWKADTTDDPKKIVHHLKPLLEAGAVGIILKMVKAHRNCLYAKSSRFGKRLTMPA
ncbi:MAG: hypothetical protein WDO13_19025 [Verrucomicrobiota bacterium]